MTVPSVSHCPLSLPPSSGLCWGGLGAHKCQTPSPCPAFISSKMLEAPGGECEGRGDGGEGVGSDGWGVGVSLSHLAFSSLPSTRALLPRREAQLDGLNGALFLRNGPGQLQEGASVRVISTDPHLEATPGLALEINTPAAGAADVSAPVSRSRPGQALPRRAASKGPAGRLAPGLRRELSCHQVTVLAGSGLSPSLHSPAVFGRIFPGIPVERRLFGTTGFCFPRGYPGGGASLEKHGTWDVCTSQLCRRSSEETLSLPSKAVWPLATFLTSLSLAFLICKVGLIYFSTRIV